MTGNIPQGQVSVILWIIALVILGLGIYLLKLSGKMRREERVSDFLIPAAAMRQVTDKRALAHYLSKRVRVLSVSCILFGLLLILYQLLHFPSYLAVAFALALLVVYLWFSRELQKAVKSF